MLIDAKVSSYLYFSLVFTSKSVAIFEANFLSLSLPSTSRVYSVNFEASLTF